MKTWQIIGSYLRRGVEFLGIGSFANFQVSPSTSQSLVMVLFQEKNIKLEHLTSFLDVLSGSLPLAIAVSGPDSRAVFDYMLRLLGSKSLGAHIMTKLCDEGNVSDALNCFFWSTWPSEERFDEWKNYSVVAVGDESYQEAVLRECGRFLRGKEEAKED